MNIIYSDAKRDISLDDASDTDQQSLMKDTLTIFNLITRCNRIQFLFGF